MSGRAKTEQNFNRFLGQLRALGADLDDSGRRVVNTMRNVGFAETKKEPPVNRSGYLRKMWFRLPIHKSGGSWKAGYHNETSYAMFVNNGHRIVNKAKETVGWVPGAHMLERGINAARRQAETIFRQEVQRVKQKGGF